MLYGTEDEELYSIPGAAEEMPPPQAIHGGARGPGHRALDQIPLLATTGHDKSSKESVDMPMEAMTHPLVEKVPNRKYISCRLICCVCAAWSQKKYVLLCKQSFPLVPWWCFCIIPERQQTPFANAARLPKKHCSNSVRYLSDKAHDTHIGAI